MLTVVNHPVYGEIAYEEGFWTGKKTLMVNRVVAQKISKKEFWIDGKAGVIKGNYAFGATLCIGGENIVLSPKLKWYEILLAVLPIIFVLTWGNIVALCKIFPVVGGAIGGAIGGFLSALSPFLMRRVKSPLFRVLIGLGVLIATVLITHLVALLILKSLIK